MESLICRRPRTTVAPLVNFIKYYQSKHRSIRYQRFSYWSNTSTNKNIAEKPSDRKIFRALLSTSQSAVKTALVILNNKHSYSRLLHSLQKTENGEETLSLQKVENDEKEQEAAAANPEEEEEGLVNEFLGRLVAIMRSKLIEAYPHAGRDVIDGMLEIIMNTVIHEMEKGSFSRFETFATNASSPETRDFSQDLWKTVWEVSNSIVEDMQNTQVKMEIQGYLQSDEMKEISAFAKVVGVTGDLLRDMKMYFAEQKKADIEFRRNLDRLVGRDFTSRLFGSGDKSYKSKLDDESTEGGEEGSYGSDEEKKPGSGLPIRHAKLKLEAYGLDLSKPSWTEIGQRLEEAERKISPEEPTVLSGKAKAITKQVLSLPETEDPSELLTQWRENVKPRRVDWLALLQQLDELKKKDLHLKAVEFTLRESSFEATVRDYAKLLDSYAKEDRFEDAERILQVMEGKGFSWDAVMCSVLIDMYSKLGNLDRAKEAFEQIRTLGLQPDQKAYSLMIMAYVKSGFPKAGESLMREMEAKDMKPGKEVYMALLRAFAQKGQVDGAQRIFNTMQFTGINPNLESCTLLVEAYGQSGDPDQARNVFDHMIKAGHKPDDKCTSKMLAAYEKKNYLDKALSLLLDLEKDGFKLGVEASTILIDWLGKLGLVDEAEQVFREIATNEVPFKVYVSLCDMYARARLQQKALDMLGNLENSIERLNSEGFERLIHGLLFGGLIDEAKRINDIMQNQGLTPSEPVNVALMAAQAFPRKKPTGSRK